MLIPQLKELDSYDENGRQIDDINSLVEYFSQVVLNKIDNTPEDEDDDNARNYNYVQNIFIYNFYSSEISLFNSPEEKTFFSEYTADKISSISFDIIIPPPKSEFS